MSRTGPEATRGRVPSPRRGSAASSRSGKATLSVVASPRASRATADADDPSVAGRGQSGGFRDVAEWWAASAQITDQLEMILRKVKEQRGYEGPAPDQVLATVLFTDIVGSTAKLAEVGDRRWRDLLEQHRALVRRELARFGGSEIDTAGDGFFASFDGPGRAIRCACAIVDAVRGTGVDIRMGLHTGECELVDGKVGGIAVHIGARVAAAAEPGQVLVSRTVKDVVAGSGIKFCKRSATHLKGVPGVWRLYSVEQIAV
jgi:class 3 adenylate cyclase